MQMQSITDTMESLKARITLACPVDHLQRLTIGNRGLLTSIVETSRFAFNFINSSTTRTLAGISSNPPQEIRTDLSEADEPSRFPLVASGTRLSVMKVEIEVTITR
jgi:hypothetical protein